MYIPVPPLLTTLPTRRVSRAVATSRLTWLLAAGLASLATCGSVRAISPAPDGDYPNANTAEGEDALFHLQTGQRNTALGYQALHETIAGRYNTAVGYRALYEDTSGQGNTAVGHDALSGNTTGTSNTALGENALGTNTTADKNTALGSQALGNNHTGADNTATGADALAGNVTGNFNTADGQGALSNNTDGEINTASGARALFSNTTGNNNAAHGAQALIFNTTGDNNTASGTSALLQNTVGVRNTAAGAEALRNNTTGNNNIAIGAQAGSNLTTGNNNIAIGAPGLVGEANTIRIGKGGTQKRAFIQGIFGSTVPNGSPVRVDSKGHLGTMTSSARFKDEIKPMENASEALLALEPVTFRYKTELDPDAIPQFGLVAEQVEKIDPNLVVRDADGRVNTVRYEAVNAMLLNEFLKEHRKVAQLQEAQKKITDLEAALAEQKKQIDTLTSGLQKISERLELRSPNPQVAANGR